MTTDELIQFWTKLGAGTVHPDDTHTLGSVNGFETRLVPLPWNGPIATSRVFVAMLNPSLDPDDVGYEAGDIPALNHVARI